MSDYFGGLTTGGRGSLTDSIDTGRTADLDGGRCRRMRRATEVR
jgi:hypothetical protein